MIIYDLETRSFAMTWSNQNKAIAALGAVGTVGGAAIGAIERRKKIKERAEKEGWDPTRTRIAMTRATYRGALTGAVGTAGAMAGGYMLGRGISKL